MSTILAGLTIGAITGGSVLLAEIIGGNSTITLREAVGVGVFTAGIVWWMGRKFQAIEDDLKQSGIERSKIKEDLDKIKKRLDCDEDD